MPYMLDEVEAIAGDVGGLDDLVGWLVGWDCGVKVDQGRGYVTGLNRIHQRNGRHTECKERGVI